MIPEHQGKRMTMKEAVDSKLVSPTKLFVDRSDKKTMKIGVEQLSSRDDSDSSYR
jgi:hypothetical protein